MHKQRAQIVVEFAILLPVFVMIVLGIVGFGRVFYAYVELEHEARAAARVMTKATCTNLTTSTLNRECNLANESVKVTRTANFDTLTYFLGSDGVIQISASASMPLLS